MTHILDDLVNTIPHTAIRRLTARALAAAPAPFWTAPASTTGKYHPADSLGTGGLIRHTRKVYRLTLALLAADGIPPTSHRYSIALAAALLHDTHKVTTESTHSHFDHPLRAAEALRTLLPEYPSILPYQSDELLHCIASHMGRWNTSPYTNITLPTPETSLAKLVHLADYLASRKHITLTD